MIGRSADDRQAESDIDALIEIQRFERDQRLIVIHAERRVVGGARGAVEHGVGRQGPHGPDAEGARLLARAGRMALSGDDGLLAAVVRVLGENGFRVIGAHEILQEALGPRGVLTSVSPDAQAMADIERGVAVVRALGTVDVGQCCVVQQGFVLAVEAVEGTDAMLSRCGDLARSGPGGVLVKLVKPNQERRADLPTIGPITIQGAIAAGLRGVAFEAEGTILADKDACIAAADAAGLFLLGLDPETVHREK